MMDGDILAFDFGNSRIGVARADSVAKIAEPLLTLRNDATLDNRLDELVLQYRPVLFVVGRPRGLDSQSTIQTLQAEKFAKRLASRGIKVQLQDEALTTVQAEAQQSQYKNASIDEIAATLILEDYLGEH